MRNSINKMGKIVAVSAGIVLMGVVFSGCGFLKSTGNSIAGAAIDGIASGLTNSAKSTSTKTKTASNESNNVVKCSGNEIKTNTGIEKGVCKDGKRNGAWKYYDKDGYIQKEITWQNGEMTLQKEYDKDENPKLATAYNKGKIVSKREYKFGKFEFFTHYYTEDNVSVEREYYIDSLENIAKETTKQIKEKASEIAKQRAESKVKKPTMQEVAKSKGAMEAYREKLKAQYEKELQIELAKIPTMPNFDSYSDNELITLIKNNKILPKGEVVKFVKFSPTINGDNTTKNLILSLSHIRNEYGYIAVIFDFQILFEDVNRNNRIGIVGEVTDDVAYAGCKKKSSLIMMNRENGLFVDNHYTCRTFAKHYKQLIDKSMFKDKIYKHLQKPKNQ